MYFGWKSSDFHSLTVKVLRGYLATVDSKTIQSCLGSYYSIQSTCSGQNSVIVTASCYVVILFVSARDFGGRLFYDSKNSTIFQLKLLH